MRKRRLVWGGVVVAVVAMAGLGVYFVRVGLEHADKLASVIGVFVALVGLVIAVYGVVGDRAGDQPVQGAEAEPDVSASGSRSVAIGGDNSGVISTGDGATNVQMRAEASGHGRIYQAGGDQTINEE
ncbi:hypothetical protein ACBJ59_37565 [Nonomuraea sp. MTCD27]|uniref:hypothetical protein n=1 Tax=Nonomuraea sp. MTCD27 TaxID=1676747 RepID=UPI0035BF6C7A